MKQDVKGTSAVCLQLFLRAPWLRGGCAGDRHSSPQISGCSLAHISAVAQAEQFCSQHSRAGPPTLEVCGGNIFNHSKAIVCLVQQREGSCSHQDNCKGILDRISSVPEWINALHTPLHTLVLTPEKPNSLSQGGQGFHSKDRDFTGRTVNVRSFSKPLITLVPPEYFFGRLCVH